MRRRAGVGAIQKQRLEQEKYKEKGSEIQENQFQQMSKQLEVFRENLEEFATKHKSEIKKNAQFRRQFQEMCAAIGVDPLASGKGFWSVLGWCPVILFSYISCLLLTGLEFIINKYLLNNPTFCTLYIFFVD